MSLLLLLVQLAAEGASMCVGNGTFLRIKKTARSARMSEPEHDHLFAFELILQIAKYNE